MDGYGDGERNISGGRRRKEEKEAAAEAEEEEMEVWKARVRSIELRERGYIKHVKELMVC